MTHASATPFQFWSALSVITTLFFVRHIYKFDRFECFKWSKNSSASFTRFMIYTYTISIPFIMAYSFGFAIIKTIEGNQILPGGGSIPKQIEFWTPTHRAWALPLYFFFSVGWSLEITTHLEELCFWAFLVQSTSESMNWFKTIYFKIWAVGSVLATGLMIGSNVYNRNDYLKGEAYTYLFGSCCGLVLTIGFLPIVIRFPSFLRKLKAEGVDMVVLIRLRRNHEFNIIRMYFRFLFLVPLLILAADGIRPAHSHINTHVEWTDFLAILGGLGCAISSVMTLMIFFPRSIESEIAREERERDDMYSMSMEVQPHPPQSDPKKLQPNGNQKKSPLVIIGETTFESTHDESTLSVPVIVAPPRRRPQGPVINIHPPTQDLERDGNGNGIIYPTWSEQSSTDGDDLRMKDENGGGGDEPFPLTSRNLAMHTALNRHNIRSFRSPIGH